MVEEDIKKLLRILSKPLPFYAELDAFKGSVSSQ